MHAAQIIVVNPLEGLGPFCGAVLLHPRNGVPGQVQQTGSHVVEAGRGDPAEIIRAI
jgi:hypothetical protein